MICLVLSTVCTLSFCLIEAAPSRQFSRAASNSSRVRSSLLHTLRLESTRFNSDLFVYPFSLNHLSHSRAHRTRSSYHPTDSLRDGNNQVSLLPEERQGLTFDLCCEKDDCAGELSCEGIVPALDEILPCSFETQSCRCIPGETDGTECTVDADCPDGEICAIVNAENEESEGAQLCISAAARHYELSLAPLNESIVALSGESCVTSSQCAGERVCGTGRTLFDQFETLCETPPVSCICVDPNGPITCVSDDDCETAGEVCAAVVGAGNRACASKALADGSRRYTHQGLTAVFCYGDQDCLGERACRGRQGEPCVKDCVCTAIDPKECVSDDDCDRPLEICAISRTTSNQECVSQLDAKGSVFYDHPTQPTPSSSSLTSSGAPPSSGATPSSGPTPSGNGVPSETASLSPSLTPTADPICVDAASLAHLRSSELVYPENVAARVLCDVNGSCATPGHIVQFRGTPMRMSSYCRMVGCIPSVMLVNSPRVRVGLRIPTKSDGLLFTAFAAKYDTRVEEFALKTVLRLGLW